MLPCTQHVHDKHLGPDRSHLRKSRPSEGPAPGSAFEDSAHGLGQPVAASPPAGYIATTHPQPFSTSPPNTRAGRRSQGTHNAPYQQATPAWPVSLPSISRGLSPGLDCGAQSPTSLPQQRSLTTEPSEGPGSQGPPGHLPNTDLCPQKAWVSKMKPRCSGSYGWLSPQGRAQRTPQPGQEMH